MDFSPIIDNWSLYLHGLWITLALTSSSLIIGFAIACLLACGKYYGIAIIRMPCEAIIYYLRGTPFLVQLYLLYYGLAQYPFIRESFLWWLIGEPLWCAATALSLNTGAYTAEILYGAIKATPRGETEAGAAYGFSKLQILCAIIIPSVLRRIIPVYTNETVFLLQATALASTVTVWEITKVARHINAKYYAPFEAFITAGILYWLVSYSIIIVFAYWERRLRTPI